LDKGSIRKLFSNNCGIYLWTNKVNGNQYIGSSGKLGNRICNYLSSAYINNKAQCGDVIAKSINKYGINNFHLEVLVMGPSITREFISNNTPHIL